MIKFVYKNYRDFFTVILLLMVITCVFGGAIGGSIFGQYICKLINNIDEAFINEVYIIVITIIGGLAGLLIGLSMSIICGGIVATFLSIDENIDIITKNIINVKEKNILQTMQLNEIIGILKNKNTFEKKESEVDVEV